MNSTLTDKFNPIKWDFDTITNISNKLFINHLLKMEMKRSNHVSNELKTNFLLKLIQASMIIPFEEEWLQKQKDQFEDDCLQSICVMQYPSYTHNSICLWKKPALPPPHSNQHLLGETFWSQKHFYRVL